MTSRFARRNHRRPGMLRKTPFAMAGSNAALLGLLEIVGLLGYVVGGNPLPTQIVCLLLKCIILVTSLSGMQQSTFARVWPIITPLVVIPALNAVVNLPTEWSSVLKTTAFSANLVITLLVLKPDDLHQYLKSVAIGGTLLTLIYIVQVHGGAIDDNYGRYYYFNQSHPNLGAEISAVLVICAAVTLPFRYLMIVAAVAVYSILLMQGRAALLVSVAGIAARLAIDLRAYASRSSFNAAIVIGAVAIVGLAATPFLLKVVIALLQLDDEYRGTGSGFVGRDRLWEHAFEIFEQSPFFGAGASFFEDPNQEPVHTFYLYGLTLYGITSIPIYICIFSAGVIAYRRNPKAIAVIASFLIFTVFNARFMNLNLYPFVVYVALFALAALPLPSLGKKPRRRQRLDRDNIQGEPQLHI